MKWRHEAGYQTFRSELPDKRVCSVWFSENYSVAVDQFEQFAQTEKLALGKSETDSLGRYWPMPNGRLIRAVTKEGESRRVGLALFVPKD